jgi:two-component system, NtrC family, response regulator PilR
MNEASARLLIVDDKAQMREVLQKFLVAEGYAVETAESAEEALDKFTKGSFDLVLSDIRMPLMDGNELLEAILKIKRDAVVILMTAFGSIEAAVEAIKQGATDYISKPFQMEEVLLRISRALKEKKLEKRVADLEEQLSQKNSLEKIVGSSQPMKKLRQIIERIAPLNETVLITGETGTGKELVARALHETSHRNAKPFVALDCSSIPETLIESELFGHEKGSFTGANETRKGLFEIAEDGTLFLDEIESLSLAVQTKLLRVLQERSFRRVGGRSDLRFSARVLSATNQDLEKLIETGAFRRDLYYRFAVLPINVPPLRERREDIPELVCFLLKNRGNGNLKISNEAMQILINHDWQGNVRELENVISYISALGGEFAAAEDLPILSAKIKPKTLNQENLPLAELEKNHILRVFESSGRNRVQTAKLLGIDRRTLYNKLRQFGIDENF